jgi:hypothetical protein
MWRYPSDEDTGPNPDAPTDQKKVSSRDDAEDGGVSLTEPIAPNSISSGMLEQSDPSTAALVSTDVPFFGVSTYY